MEKELFVRLALGTDPTKAEASGMSKTALRSLGIGVGNLTPEEKAHRTTFAKKVLMKVKPLKEHGEIGLLPGFGPHSGFPTGEQLVLNIPEEVLKSVSEKIVRGCEYKLNGGSYIEQPLHVKIYFLHDRGAEDLTAFFKRLPVTTLGPGFEAIRGQAPPEEGERIVLYRITIWGTLRIYASIDNEEALRKAP